MNIHIHVDGESKKNEKKKTVKKKSSKKSGLPCENLSNKLFSW
jgi:hypothetical protein